MLSWVVFGFIVLGLLYSISLYNGLVSKRNRFRNAFAQIDVQLERRYDLIPNLVETAKKYMEYERETLESVIKARNAAQSACRTALNNQSDSESIDKLSRAESLLSQSLGRLMVLTENYPDLKAHETMRTLMEELNNSENLVAFSRQAYNDAVMSYNTAIEQFPASTFAAAMGFHEAAFLKVDSDAKRTPPKVHFN